MPLVTQGPLQAFDVELETAGLCVSVCVCMPSSTVLTGSSGDCEDNWCCLPPIPLCDSPSWRCCLTSNVFLEWHRQSLLQDQDSLGSRQRQWWTQTHHSRTPWSSITCMPLLLKLNLDYEKKRTILLWVLVTRTAFWILWFISSSFPPSFLPPPLFFASVWLKTTTTNTSWAAMVSKTLTLLRLVSYGIIIIIVVNTENFPSIWWVLPPLIPVSTGRETEACRG